MQTPSDIDPPSPKGDDPVGRELRRMTRRGFAWGGAAILAGLAGREWAVRRPEEGRLIWPLRRALEFNEKVGRAAFDPDRLSRAFPEARARMPKVNGRYGLKATPEPDTWRLRVSGPGGQGAFSLAEIKALPRVAMTTELKCIEGWSEVVTWAGARLVDFARLAGLGTRSGRPPDPSDDPADLLHYVAMATPDASYYVGLDAPSAFHPQTLLCYEMNGQPLEPLHGAPLRLAIPVKYGIKSIKQVGTIRFTDARPPDYWAELGYDWYAGH